MGFRFVTGVPSPSPSVDTHTVFAGELYQCVRFYEMVAVASASPHRAHLHVVFRCDDAEVALQNVHVCRIVMYLFAPYGCSDRCAGGVFQHLVRETVTDRLHVAEVVHAVCRNFGVAFPMPSVCGMGDENCGVVFYGRLSLPFLVM